MTGILRTFTLIGVAATLLAGSAFANSTRVDGFAAVVNDRVITVGDVMTIVQPADEQLRAVYSGEELVARREKAYEGALQNLIERALVLEEFKQSGAVVPDRLVGDRVNELINERFGNDRSKLEEALVEENLTLQDWMEDIKERLVVMILSRQEVAEKVAISPAEVRRMYEARIDSFRVPEQVRLSMIVLNRGKTDADRTAKREQAIVVRGRLLAGADFGDVAREVSEGAKAATGGDWGWMDPTELRSELKAALARTQPGDISEVVETEEQLFIFRPDDMRSAGVTPFESVRHKLEEEIRQNEEERLHNAWMERLRRKHFVKVY